VDALGVPERQFSFSLPSADRLAEFSDFVESRESLSFRTKELLVSRARSAPADRLEINLSVVLRVLSSADVESVLEDGLTSDEQAALWEIQVSDAPPWVREVAHGMLNVHERWVMKRAFGKTFRAARAAAERRSPVRKPLDVILGG